MYLQNFDWLIGILETELNCYNISNVQLDLEKKRNEDELENDIKKIKFKDVQLMASKEYIEYDDKEEASSTLENQDIFDLVMNKVVDEPEMPEEKLRTQVTPKEASKCLDTLMSYIQESEDFCEEDFIMLNKLSTRFDFIREKHKTQSNISNYMAPLVEKLKITYQNN